MIGVELLGERLDGLEVALVHRIEASDVFSVVEVESDERCLFGPDDFTDKLHLIQGVLLVPVLFCHVNEQSSQSNHSATVTEAIDHVHHCSSSVELLEKQRCTLGKAKATDDNINCVSIGIALKFITESFGLKRR